MVKKEVVERKLCQMEKSLGKISAYRPLSYEEFLEHPVARDVVEYNLFIAINAMIDIVSHIVSDEGLGEVDALADGFRILGKQNYWQADQTEIYVKMVAFRNMISHQYADVSGRVVYGVLQTRLDDIGAFKQKILDRL